MFEQWYAIYNELQEARADFQIGDADGLGETRKKELVKSGLQLGIGRKDDIHVIEDK